MSKFNKSIYKVIMGVAIILATEVTAVVFIPAFIWGLCNRLSVKEICYSYWIEGYGEQLSDILYDLEEA